MISVARSGPPRVWPHGRDRRRSVSCRRGFPPCQLTLRTLDRPVARSVSAYGGNPLPGLTVPADHGATASKRPFKSTQAGVRSARSLEPLGICHRGSAPYGQQGRPRTDEPGSELRHGCRRAREGVMGAAGDAAIVAPLVLSFRSCPFGPIVKDRSGPVSDDRGPRVDATDPWLLTAAVKGARRGT